MERRAEQLEQLKTSADLVLPATERFASVADMTQRLENASVDMQQAEETISKSTLKFLSPHMLLTLDSYRFVAGVNDFYEELRAVLGELRIRVLELEERVEIAEAKKRLTDAAT